MKKTVLVLLLPVVLAFSACSAFTYSTKLGMKEKKWLYNTVSSDLVYAEGNVKAYRSAGSYYYFKDGVLVKVTQSLLPVDKI
jgi:hypothetical protein